MLSNLMNGTIIIVVAIIRISSTSMNHDEATGLVAAHVQLSQSEASRLGQRLSQSTGADVSDT